MSGWFEASKARQWQPAFWRSSLQAPGGRSARSCPFSLTVTRLPGRCVHLIFLHSGSVAGSTTCWAHIVQMQQTCHRCVTAARVQALARVACCQLGFNQGASQPGFVQFPTALLLTDGVTLPAWVKSPECTGSEQSVGECGTLSYGDTETASGTPCWPGQLLRCTR